MEVCLSAGCRMSSRAAGGDDRIQNAAGALGQGTDPGLQENTAQSTKERRTASRENRSLLSPDRQPQLSTDDRALGLADACHDYSFLSGMVPDALHRPPIVHGIHVLDFELLSGLAKRTVPKKLAAIASLLASANGSRNWADHHQHARRSGSARRQADRFRPHSQVSCRIEVRQSRRKKIPQAPGMGSMD